MQTILIRISKSFQLCFKIAYFEILMFTYFHGDKRVISEEVLTINFTTQLKLKTFFLIQEGRLYTVIIHLYTQVIYIYQTWKSLLTDC